MIREVIYLIVYGYSKGFKYSGDGTLLIKTRIPSIHGPYSKSDYRGSQIRNYVRDVDLPYYPSILLPHLPNEGEVVVLTSVDNTPNQLLIIGITGGSYQSGTLIGGV